MADFKRLSVWQKSHHLVLELYAASASFPVSEGHGLTVQIRRSAVSVAANIAEGSVRGGDREFARFLQISLGSATELEYHLLLAHDLGFLPSAHYRRLRDAVIEIQRMLTSLIKRLKTAG